MMAFMILMPQPMNLLSMNSNIHILNLAAYEAPEIVEDSRSDWVFIWQ